MLSLFIPTYNPNVTRLNHVLEAFKNQTLEYDKWQLIIIDNNSSNGFETNIDLSWHPNAKIVSEKRQGLTYARLKGIENCKYDIVVMVDDDNILDPTYLENVVQIFNQNPEIGCIGGKSIPYFESENQPAYLSKFYSLLALRDLGNEIIVQKFENNYPSHAPIGAGMAFRKSAIQNYIHKVSMSEGIITDRKGDSLSSSGDNDMVMEILKASLQVGYFPVLKLQHIIPESRTSVSYLSRLNFSIQKSWVQFLGSHNICPWTSISRCTIPFRKAKAWFTYRAWKGEANYIKWKGACGMFEGLASNRK